MKKRLLTMMFAGMLIFGLLTGCGSDAEIQDVQIQEVSAEDDIEENNEGVEDNSQVVLEQDPIEEVEAYRTLNVSDWGYENLWYLNRDYLMAKSDDKYVIINSATGERFGDYAFDNFTPNCQDGTFIVEKKNDDGTYNCGVLYFNGDEFRYRTSAENFDGKVVDYRDGILVVYLNGDGYYHLITQDSEGHTHDGYLGLKSTENVFISYGTVILDHSTYYTDLEASDWMDDASEIKSFIDEFHDREFSVNINNAEFDGTITRTPLTYDGKPVWVWPNTPNDEGWVTVSLADKKDNDTWESGSDGFFNIETGEFIECTLTDVFSTLYFTVDNGSAKCTVTDSKALVAVEKDDNGAKIYKIFDLKTGNWASDKTYKGVYAFGYGKYVLALLTDGKWSYINSEDMSETESFDYASEFCNGYAIVINNGKAHLINEEFQQVSEEFEAEAAIVATKDYFEFSDLNGKSVFFAKMSDGLYHLVTVE